MLPTTAQYAAANRAAGAQKAAHAFFQRLMKAEASPAAVALAETFCLEMDVAFTQAYEPIYQHLEAILLGASLSFDEPVAPYAVTGEAYAVKAA